MKKWMKVLVGILVAFLLVILIYLSLMNIEGFIGSIQNKKEFDISEIDKDQNVVFLGDSITNGYMADGGLFADFSGYRGVIEEDLKNNNIKTTNYAVGGYKVSDVMKQINEEVSLDEVNKEIMDHSENKDPELLKNYPTNNGDLTIIDSIKNADAVVITIGANDIIEKVLSFDEQGNMSVDFKNIRGKLKDIRKEKNELFDKIHEINPNVQIYDVGIYFAYPHQSDMFMRVLYPILMFAENIIFIDDDSDNIHFVKIRDNMQSDIKENVSNPNDIHPSKKGHKVIANEVLKEMEKYN